MREVPFEERPGTVGRPASERGAGSRRPVRAGARDQRGLPGCLGHRPGGLGALPLVRGKRQPLRLGGGRDRGAGAPGRDGGRAAVRRRPSPDAGDRGGTRARRPDGRPGGRAQPGLGRRVRRGAAQRGARRSALRAARGERGQPRRRGGAGRRRRARAARLRLRVGRDRDWRRRGAARGAVPRRLGFAGEFGHLTIDPYGPPCGCGGRGCLERLAGQDALLRLAGWDARMRCEGARPEWPGAMLAQSAREGTRARSRRSARSATRSASRSPRSRTCSTPRPCCSAATWRRSRRG